MAMSDDLRGRIIEAAIRLLEQAGPKGFGQVKVAREAGIQQGHLTYYFPRKSDLLLAVIEALNERARRRLGRVSGELLGMDARARRQALFTEARAMMRDRKRTRVLIGLLAEAEDDAELQALIHEREARFQEWVKLLLGDGVDALDAELLVATLRGLGMLQLAGRMPLAHLDALLGRLEEWLDR